MSADFCVHLSVIYDSLGLIRLPCINNSFTVSWNSVYPSSKGYPIYCCHDVAGSKTICYCAIKKSVDSDLIPPFDL